MLSSKYQLDTLIFPSSQVWLLPSAFSSTEAETVEFLGLLVICHHPLVFWDLSR